MGDEGTILDANYRSGVKGEIVLSRERSRLKELST